MTSDFSRRASISAYRTLLRTLPREFQAEYSDPMTEAFERLLDSHASTRAIAALWMFVLRDFLFALGREWKAVLMPTIDTSTLPTSSNTRRMLGLAIDVAVAWFGFWTTFDLLDRSFLEGALWCNAPSLDGARGCVYDQELWGAIGGAALVTAYAVVSTAAGRSLGSLVMGTRLARAATGRAPGLRVALARVGLWFALMLGGAIVVGGTGLLVASIMGPENMPPAGWISRTFSLALFFGGPTVMYAFALRGGNRRTLFDRATGTRFVRSRRT